MVKSLLFQLNMDQSPAEVSTIELHLSGRWLSRTPIIRTLVIRNSNWTLVIRNSNYSDAGYPELQLSGRWLSGTPIIRMGLALRLNILYRKCSTHFNGLECSPIFRIHKRNIVSIFYLYVNM